MPVTVNTGLSVPTHGSEVNVWDTDVNGNSTAIDAMFGSFTRITAPVAGNATTLTTTQLDVSILRFDGLSNVTTTVNVSAVRKAWVIENVCTGTGVLVFTGGAGNQCAGPPGSSMLYFDGANVAFINMGQIGDYKQYAGTTAPPWVLSCTIPPWLVCDGSAFSGITYPILAGIIGGTVLPDFRGSAFYATDAGVGRLTVANSGVNGTTLFARGGAANVTLTQPNLPNVNLNAQTAFITSVNVGGINAGSGGVAVDTTPNSTATPQVKLNGGVTQQAATTLSPACVGGVIMIRAG